MKVQVIIAGFNRCMSTTFPAIETRIIEPLRNAGCDVSVDMFIGRSRTPIINTRSNENGTGEWELPDAAMKYPFRYLDADRIERRTRRLFEKARKVGDPWPESNFKNLRNQVSMLEMLRIAGRKVDRRADAVLYVRPDLLPLDDFDIARYADLVATTVVVPYWHRFKGYNDRVALMPPKAARAHLGRIRLARSFLAKNKKLHSERFLKHVMRDFPVAEVMTERFVRARIGGVLAEENFEHRMESERLVELGVVPGTNGVRADSRPG